MTTLAVSSNPIDTARFIVASEVMHKFVSIVERVARHVGTVLIVGETGTGKESIARMVHEHSLRASKPFVEINCAALPESLVESELFGYEKGAFSSADTGKPGLFELAHLGTVFLDEIGELDLKVQVKLLRVLDRAPYYRLGGHRKINSDVRVVAATNRNLKAEVSAGRFRKDLYHRLSEFELCVPPLRERPEDITALAEYFLSQHGDGLRFSPEALRILQSYSWPGNVRELQNAMRKVAVLASGPEIGASEVRRELTNADTVDPAKAETPESATQLFGVEAQAIKKALEKTGGHRGQAAEQLGISRRTLSRKLREYGFSSARRAARVALGVLNLKQQRAFRAAVRVEASLRTEDGRELGCTAVNLSETGMGLEGLDGAVSVEEGVFCVTFRLPGSEAPLEIPARLAWAGMNGRAGISFAELNPAAHQELRQWLRKKMAEEGWTIIEADASESVQAPDNPDQHGIGSNVKSTGAGRTS